MSFKIGDTVRLIGTEWFEEGREDLYTVVDVTSDRAWILHDGYHLYVYDKDQNPLGFARWGAELVTDNEGCDYEIESDPINPPHYKQYSGFEVIDITEQLPFNTGNAVKYILRAGYKGDAVEDFRKAIWYLEREIDRLNV